MLNGAGQGGSRRRTFASKQTSDFLQGINKKAVDKPTAFLLCENHELISQTK